MSTLRTLSTRQIFHTISLCTLALCLWPLTSLYDQLQVSIVKNYPVWAWRHGTEEMQAGASRILVKQLSPGTAFEEVVRLLGPGSSDWPRIRIDKFDDPDLQGSLGYDAVATFNIGKGGSMGIDVYCLKEHVVRASCYD